MSPLFLNIGMSLLFFQLSGIPFGILPLFVAVCTSTVQASALLPPLSHLSVNHPVHMPCFFPSFTVVSLSQCHLPMVSVLALGLWAQALPFDFLHSVGSQRTLFSSRLDLVFVPQNSSIAILGTSIL